MRFVVKSAKIYDTEALNRGLKYALFGAVFCPIWPPRPIGKWSDCTVDFFKRSIRSRFNNLVLSSRLWPHLADLNEQAQERLFLIAERIKATKSVTEDLKETDLMAWV